MPLRNRVTPYGEIVAIPERGTMFGNRGVLHDDHRRLVRTSQLRRWLCCVLEFKGIHRVVMTPRRYTELFFLDEATALSAGHRPCFECRRRAALAFQACWLARIGGPAMADHMDHRLSADRRARGGGRITFVAPDAARLPAGAFLAHDGHPWLVTADGGMRRWTPAGYDGGPRPLPTGAVTVLTPRATVEVLHAGYRPQLHPSAAPGGDERDPR
jgi:hypothetical protein